MEWMVLVVLGVFGFADLPAPPPAESSCWVSNEYVTDWKPSVMINVCDDGGGAGN